MKLFSPLFHSLDGPPVVDLSDVKLLGVSDQSLDTKTTLWRNGLQQVLGNVLDASFRKSSSSLSMPRFDVLRLTQKEHSRRARIVATVLCNSRVKST